MYIKRDIENTILNLMKQFRSVTITGPRQSGKSTLSRHLLPNFKYVNLEDPSELEHALGDPKSFLEKYPKGSIIDEIQKAPKLLSYLQVMLDEDQEKGQYILTGSQNFALSKAISQSMVGRTAPVTLLPLSMSEIKAFKPDADVLDVILNGGYPDIYTGPVEARSFYSAYNQLYLERDVRDLRQVGDLVAFREFMVMAAGRSAQLMNYADLSGITGYDAKTIKQWFSVLETSYVAYRLPPLLVNISRQLTKSPKYYFFDTGLLCNLLGIDSHGALLSHPLWGSIFENFVITEMYKERVNNNIAPNFHYIRDKSGSEIDLVEHVGNEIRLTEIKATKTFNIDIIKSLDKFDAVSKRGETLQKKVIYRGDPQTYKNIKFYNIANIPE